MATQYNIYSYIKGINGFGLPFCDTVYTATLAANTAATITVPGAAAIGATGTTTNKYIAVFSYGSGGYPVWVSANGTAAEPAGATFVLSNSELRPDGKYVYAGQILSIICDAAIDVSVAFYAVQEG